MTQPNPPGWYPDPQRRELHRYWDGTQWTDQTREAEPEQKKRNLRYLAIIGVIIVAIVVVSIIVNGQSDSEEDANRGAATTTAAAPVTSEAEAPAVQTTAAAQASCRPAPDQLTTIIASSLNDSGLSLGPAFVVSAPGGLTYVGANIMRGDTKESSADVWVEKDGAVFALSGSAREYSLLPDGRRITDASAGDDYGIAVQNCTTAR